ncbi:hypothetical protein HDU96_009748 [Phlyctochytrium bullatum]|nr:hypothetical protein HDU96_009748 [Phlyctochytrium bullatum]
MLHGTPNLSAQTHLNLHERFGWPISEETTLDVMLHGTPKEFGYCLSQVRYISPSKLCSYIETLPDASMNLGHMKVMVAAFGIDDEFWIPYHLSTLMTQCSLEMAEYLYEQRDVRCCRAGLFEVAKRGNAELFKFLVEADSCAVVKLNVDVLSDAAVGGSVEILKFLRQFSHLRKYWNSSLANLACAHGKLDAARYLFDEIGLPITSVHYRTASKYTTHNPVLYNLDSLGHRFQDLNVLTAIFANACGQATLEQIARLSERTPSSPDAYTNAARNGRIDVLRFLHSHRAERPGHDCFSIAGMQSIEMMEFFFEEVGIRPYSAMLQGAARSGRLDHVKYLLNLMTAEESLDLATGIALRASHVDIAKYLFRRRNGSRPQNSSLGYRLSMDMIAFITEECAARLTRNDFDPYFLQQLEFNFDVVKYLIEDDSLAIPLDVSTLLGSDHTSRDPDLLQYVLAQGRYQICSTFVEAAVEKGNVSILRVLYRAFPEYFTASTFKYTGNSLPVLAFLSAVVPQVITPAVMTHVISNCRMPLTQVTFLLERHPECVIPEEHLSLAAEKDTASALLLWEKAWPGGCPAKAIVAACRSHRHFLLKRFFERMDLEDPAWGMAVNECMRITSVVSKVTLGLDRFIVPKESTARVVEHALALVNARLNVVNHGM